MKKLTYLTAIVSTSLLAGACTVTIGEKFDDDSDFVDWDDEDAGNTDPGTDTTTSTSKPTTTTSPVDAGGSTPTDTDTGDATDSQNPDASTSVPPVDPVSPVDPVDPVSPGMPDQCADFGEIGSCTECLNFNCSQEWYACCGEPGCVDRWTEILDCVANPMSEDPLEDVDRCANSVAPGGDQFNDTDAMIALISCVNEEFSGNPDDDPLGHQPGDGTCTLACYGVPYLFPPQ